MSYRVLLESEFHGATDVWTEYLCLEVLPDLRVVITSRSAVLLMGEGWEAGEIVWPEGYDPENDNGDTLPISVGGKAVAGRDGDFLVGEELLPHSDDATAMFIPGQQAAAQSWLEKYGWSQRPGFRETWLEIEATLAKG
jgi:hypothetical protein